MRRRPLVLVASAVAVLVAVAVVLGVVLSGRDAAEPREDAASAGNPERCADSAPDDARACYAREFLAMVRGEDDPRPRIQAIADSAWEEGGFLLPNCHGIMHTVGRKYAGEQGVTLATLMDYLPRSNDPGCTAGFAHGLVTGVAPDIDPRQPREAATVCAEAATRFQRYSCTHGFGHAFMRIHDDRLEPALALCSALGEQAAPDCAQGAYHDYWFAVVGADEARLTEAPVTDPHELCGAQPRQFVRPCWYRAFIDTRPEGFQAQSAADLEALCAGLGGLQRGACLTAASVIGPPDPAEQLRLCAELAAPADAANCVRGTKVQNLLGYPESAFVDLIGRCELFARPTRGACYRWLGKTLSVLTDGSFGRSGCPQLAGAAARSACAAGARSMDEALVTFS